MGKPKNHIPGLAEKLSAYSEENDKIFEQYSPYHMRVMDGGYTVVDVWSTGRYYIVTTDYLALAGGGLERGGEKGQLPIDDIDGFLSGIFYMSGEL